MSGFSRAKTEVLLDALKPAPKPEVPETERIKVHAAVSRFAFLYERIRNAVDYQDEHLLRKSAIVRILKRQVSLGEAPTEIALQLIRELIGARYLPNASVSEDLVGVVGKIVSKYQAVVRTGLTGERHRAWLMGILAAEIEEAVDDHAQEKALTHFLFEALGDRIEVEGVKIDTMERRLQIYVACQRSLSRHDDEMVGYKLVRAHYTAWMRPDEWLEHPEDMALQMVGVQARVERELRHPLASKFIQAVKPWSIALGMMRDAIKEAGGEARTLFEDSATLKKEIEKIALRRSAESKKRLRRGTVRAMVYLFFTKIIIALATEIPVEQWLYQEVHRGALLVNIFFPPVLMLLVGRLIRLPGKENTERIWTCVQELLSAEGVEGTTIKIPPRRAPLSRFLFSLTYTATFFVTFGLIFFLLDLISFTWVSKLLFIFFLCLVSFFGYRLRVSARQYVVVLPKEQMRGIIFDFFFLPILRAGQWLSRTVSRLNILVIILDFFIEAPYKIFLNILEEWFAFLKEKKEELQ